MTSRRQTQLIALALALVVVGGAVLRVARFGGSIYGDELSTLYLIRNNGFFDLIGAVASDAEISPPLYFAVGWLTSHLGSSVHLFQLPSLIAGIVSIPLTYLVGSRLLNPLVGLISATFMAFNPFTLFYSTDGRAYALALALLLLTTLAMLIAVDTGRRRWWVVYGVASCLAMYTHYTTGFVLLAQFGWLVWAHPEARRAALIANVGAAAFFLPWLPSMIADTNSPTIYVLSQLQGDGFTVKRQAVENWAFGTPYLTNARVPGIFAVTLGVAGVALMALVTLVRLCIPRLGNLSRRLGEEGSRRVALAVILFLSTPVAEAAILFGGGSDLFGARNLLTASPGFALSIGALLYASGPVLGSVAAVALFTCVGIGAVRSSESKNNTIDFKAPAEAIAREARPGDVLVDSAAVLGVTPVPLTPVDVSLDFDSGPEYRLFLPKGPPPFLPSTSRIPDPSKLAARAFKRARGGRMFLVDAGFKFVDAGPGTGPPGTVYQGTLVIPRGWSVESDRIYEGIVDIHLHVLSGPDQPAD